MRSDRLLDARLLIGVESVPGMRQRVRFHRMETKRTSQVSGKELGRNH